MNARPHAEFSPRPSPIRWERENRSPRLENADALRCRAVPFVNDQQAETPQTPSELHETHESCPLSPGERARVRASQTVFFLDSVTSVINARGLGQILVMGQKGRRNGSA